MAAANELPTVLVDDYAPVDIDDDGKPEQTLSRKEWIRELGCGHSERWFDVVDPATQKPRGDAPLLRLCRQLQNTTRRL